MAQHIRNSRHAMRGAAPGGRTFNGDDLPPIGYPYANSAPYVVAEASDSTSRRFTQGQRVKIYIDGQWVHGEVVAVKRTANPVSSTGTQIKVRYADATEVFEIIVPNDPGSIRGLDHA
ncbi:hypothetical protein B0H34DRAFT_676063 [Crassisporium funariophilum]|nr:hypothetical protein B0H34DRAFT_676063 [Crassisporium funariophilum]